MTVPFEVCNVDGNTERLWVIKAETRLEANGRAATVRIRSVAGDDIGVGTGTVFEYKGRRIVITAAHVVNDMTHLLSMETSEDYVPVRMVYIDHRADIAVLIIPDQVHVRPMKFRPVKEDDLKIGTETIYSGYPNNNHLMTIKGYISSIDPWGNFYMHSYTWPGASGSSIFDKNGRLMGVLTSVGVGKDVTGAPAAIEDVVIFTPIWKLNLDLLDTNLRLLDG
jgi:S1-C subfamily serine protease